MPTFKAVPAVCDVCCSSNIEFVNNSVVYGSEKESIGDWPYCWLCHDCRASVSCHKDTRFPKGFMADRQTRALRNKFHKVFDPLWRNKLIDRTAAYAWLATQLDMQREECHAGLMSKDKLREAIAFCENYINENLNALVRRRDKRNQRKGDEQYGMPEYEFQRIRKRIKSRRAR